MITDLDQLMETRGLDALLVLGRGSHNPPMTYLTGGANLTSAMLVKKPNQPPTLFHGAMERDEAAKTGLPRRSLDDYRWDDLLKQHGGDWTRASAARLALVLTDMELTAGRIAIYGQADAGESWAILQALQSALPQLNLVGEVHDSLILEAMATKDAAQVERLRRIGQLTVAVVGRVAEFLTSHKTRNSVLVKKDGEPLTIGEVKQRINLWLAEAGAENPEETIFAAGRDAGVPHSTGNPADLLRLGQAIVFDIFPCEKGGGYFYDITRTWCLGYAPDLVLELYEQVLSVYRQISGELRVGIPTRALQGRTCELFQERGHPTPLSQPGTQEGYVHSIGHGVGLHIHERPSMRLTSPDGERLQAGMVFTVEPGLYYPERGLGVRLEDTYWINPVGQPEVLAPYPLDLLLPVK